MPCVLADSLGSAVALRTEGVDRNVVNQAGVFLVLRRPPHGGRG